jgi:ABC-type methionine transport system ATPase subunit
MPPSMATQSTRLWLSFPTQLVTQPIIYDLGKKFPIATNIRQASVTEEIGIMSVEFEGERTDISQAIQWLESLGIKVEPVEINTIEG